MKFIVIVSSTFPSDLASCDGRRPGMIQILHEAPVETTRCSQESHRAAETGPMHNALESSELAQSGRGAHVH